MKQNDLEGKLYIVNAESEMLNGTLTWDIMELTKSGAGVLLLYTGQNNVSLKGRYVRKDFEGASNYAECDKYTAVAINVSGDQILAGVYFAKRLNAETVTYEGHSLPAIEADILEELKVDNTQLVQTISRAIEMARKGTDVVIFNGYSSNGLLKAVKGETGTTIYSQPVLV